MSDQPHPGLDSLPPSVVEQLDKICDRFEAAWRAAQSLGQRPRIEDYLHDTPESERSTLLRVLIALEIAYRRQAGENAQAEEYRARFPDEVLQTLGHPGFSSGGATLGRLGQYQLLEELGRGGMGTVYKAIHLLLKRVVAIKVLPPERVQDALAVARFRREMEAVGKLDHPNLVRATDAGEADGKHFLVMEFLDGIDLQKLLQARGPLALADACELVRQAALGLQHAHEHGLVHRDIKPSNLLLTRARQVKVLDLGLALLRGDHAIVEELTATGQTMGTVDYMAPEQASDTHAVDIRADIYSLGCTLYALLAGRPPFSGPRYHASYQKMHAHAEEPVPPLRSQQPEVPEALVALLDRLLAKTPAERLATPAEVSAALKPFTTSGALSQLLLPAPPAAVQDQDQASSLTGLDPTGLPSTKNYPGSLPGTSTARPRRRWGILTGLLLAGAASVLLGVVGIALQHLRSQPGPSAILKELAFSIRRGGDSDHIVQKKLVANGLEQELEPIDPPLTPDDHFKLVGTFQQPTCWYLLWFNTAGLVEVVAHADAPQMEVQYPIRAGRMQPFAPVDPPGVHMLLLVAGPRPPAKGVEWLADQLEGIGRPPVELPKRWSIQLRDAQGERPMPSLLPAHHLQAIKDRLPPGFEPVQLICLQVLGSARTVGGPSVVREEPAANLKRNGAFAFPQAQATILCDEADLRVSVWNDSAYLYVQAIVWNDGDDMLGETADGRPIGDWAMVCLKMDPTGRTTLQSDRDYSLNSWPSMPGLSYQIRLQEHAWTTLRRDSQGRGAIRYLPAGRGRRVRVDSFVIPLTEIGKGPDERLRLAYWGMSPAPQLVVNSVGYQRKGTYYSRQLPQEKYHLVTLAARDQQLDLNQVPDGRNDPSPLPRKTVKPVPPVGAPAPEVTAKEWINSATAPRLAELRDKVVLVEFWATWCGPCVKGIPHLNRLHEQYGPKGLHILSFTDQSRKGIEPFLRQTPIRYTIGAGSDLAAEYGVTAIPQAFLIGKDGKVLWRGSPSDEELEKRIAAALDR
jgi:serine/threonine protein kinase/thiol-disulfide isomerase/thioredoxin